jgi:hypothetical protein
VAENHHVCPIHPEYAQLPPLVVDPAAAKADDAEAGPWRDTEFELISLDDAGRRQPAMPLPPRSGMRASTSSARSCPDRPSGTTGLKYPFSATEWNMRPLGVQILALAYRSGVAWNESAFANAEFDAAAGRSQLAIADADKRREVMEAGNDHAGQGVLIQPYWRSVFRTANASVRGADAPDLRASPLQVVDRGLTGDVTIQRGRPVPLRAPLFRKSSGGPFRPATAARPERMPPMLAFLLRRVLTMVLTALCLTFVVFYLTNLPPNLEKLAKSEASSRMRRCRSGKLDRPQRLWPAGRWSAMANGWA